MRKLIALGFGMAVATFGVTALADDAPKAAHADAPAAHGDKEWGDAGVIGIAAATRLDLAFSSSKPPQGDSVSGSHIGLSPSIDYFVVQNVSIGGILSLALDKADKTKTTSIGIGPRVGYNAWLTPGSLSVYPQLGILYQTQSRSVDGNDAGSGNKLTLDVGVPLLIHPVHHFHFGVGPFVSLDLSSKVKGPVGDAQDGIKDTTFGIRGEIAGWL
jgi:hypothetical protein